MYFDEVIDNRRSARLFTNDVVSENQLTKILLSNILAPSARNRQPWKFYILNTLQKNDIIDRKSSLNSSHKHRSRMPSSA